MIKGNLMYQERAKLKIGDIAEKQPDLLQIEMFLPGTAWGFLLYARTKRDYAAVANALIDAGLEPDLRRFKRENGGWRLEIWVDVPEGWQDETST